MRPIRRLPVVTLAAFAIAFATSCSRSQRDEPTPVEAAPPAAEPPDPVAAAPSDDCETETGYLLGGREPSPADNAFDDAHELDVGTAAIGAEYTQVVASLMRAEISGTQPGAFLDTFRRASDGEKDRMRRAAATALEDAGLVEWIESSAERKQAALWLSTTITPPDVAKAENVKAEARVAAFTQWDRYAYDVIIVPGYTPLDTREALPGVHPVARARLDEAARAHREGQAPFILVSGGNVYPAGTPYYEGIEMKRALLASGIPEDAIIVEARARHSTSNLRNAGRFMMAHGLSRALITPPGGGVAGSRVFDQTFYFSNPEISTFHGRCERELGYRVGTLTEAGPSRVSFTPSREVQRFNYRDPLDP